MIELNSEDTYIVTTDGWFTAPDGEEYNQVWGKVHVSTAENTLGVKPNARSTNWYLTVGTQDDHVIIAGCQVHYACKCKNPPKNKYKKFYGTHEGKIVESEKPSGLYITGGTND